MTNLFIAQNKGKRIIDNYINITSNYSGENLIITYTLDYPYPGISSDSLTVNVDYTGLSAGGIILFNKDEQTKTVTFNTSKNIPSKVTITSIEPSSDSKYRYLAKSSLEIPVPTNTEIVITASVPMNSTSRINYSASETVTSKLTFTNSVKIVYDNQDKEYMTVTGSMDSGSSSSYVLFQPPIKDGTIPKTAIIQSSTVSPTSDTLHTYRIVG